MTDNDEQSIPSRGSLCGDTAVIAAIVSALVSVVVSGLWLAAWSDAEATRLNGVYLKLGDHENDLVIHGQCLDRIWQDGYGVRRPRTYEAHPYSPQHRVVKK
jgi:hypothetical protein